MRLNPLKMRQRKEKRGGDTKSRSACQWYISIKAFLTLFSMGLKVLETFEFVRRLTTGQDAWLPQPHRKSVHLAVYRAGRHISAPEFIRFWQFLLIFVSFPRKLFLPRIVAVHILDSGIYQKEKPHKRRDSIELRRIACLNLTVKHSSLL